MKDLLRLSSLVLSLLTIFSLQAQDRSFEWASKTSGNANVWTEGVGTDAEGNIYTSGYFTGMEDFDNGNDFFFLLSEGEHDAFVSKYDPSGNFLWAFVIGSEEDERVRSMTTDDDGNVYIAGGFQGSLDFDPSGEAYNLIADSSGSFVAKYDTEGNFLWARYFDSSGYGSHAYGICLDDENNVYTSGRFTGVTNFTPGNNDEVLTSVGGTDIYVQKFSSTGDFLWVKQFGGTQNNEAFAIDVDEEGNVLTTGFFTNVCDFDPGAESYLLNTHGGTDAFVSKLDTDGNFLWAKSMGGSSYEQGHAITSDEFGNVFTTGYFKQTADFDPGDEQHLAVSNGNLDSYISKLDSEGNFEWVKTLGGAMPDRGHAIAIDRNNNVLTAGQFWGEVDLNTGDEESSYTSVDVMDLYILTLDNDGSFLKANQIGGTATEYYPQLAMFNEDLILAGTFTGNCDFDPSDDEYILEASNNYDVFIMKMASQPLGILESYESIPFSVFPNPTSDIINLRFDEAVGKVAIRVSDISGQELSVQDYEVQETIALKLEGPAGYYLIEVMNISGEQMAYRVLKN